MDTLKFNSFGNSPKSMSGYPSKLVSQNSFNPENYQNPNTSIPQLKKQMQQAINSRRSSARTFKIHNKYPSMISLMKSDISLMTNPQVQQYLPLSLLHLEVGVTEQVLALKEDKLTLMQQHNKIIGQRYRVERQLNKMKNKKERQSSDVNQLSVFDIITSTPKKKNQIIQRNQQLKSQLKQLQSYFQLYPKRAQKPQQKSMLRQIETIMESCKALEERVLRIQGNSRPTNQQRFQTFLPDRKSRQSQADEQKLLRFRQVRYNLYQQLIQSIQNADQKNQLFQLLRQNQQLLQQYDRQSFKKRSSGGFLGLQFLRQKVHEEMQSKKYFFEDLKRFKQESQRLKRQNQQMKNRFEFI